MVLTAQRGLIPACDSVGVFIGDGSISYITDVANLRVVGAGRISITSLLFDLAGGFLNIKSSTKRSEVTSK